MSVGNHDNGWCWHNRRKSTLLVAVYQDQPFQPQPVWVYTADVSQCNPFPTVYGWKAVSSCLRFFNRFNLAWDQLKKLINHINRKRFFLNRTRKTQSFRNSRSHKNTTKASSVRWNMIERVWNAFPGNDISGFWLIFVKVPKLSDYVRPISHKLARENKNCHKAPNGIIYIA